MVTAAMATASGQWIPSLAATTTASVGLMSILYSHITNLLTTSSVVKSKQQQIKITQLSLSLYDCNLLMADSRGM